MVFSSTPAQTVETLHEGQMILMTCKNGAIVAGPWAGQGMFNNKPIVTVGKRTEYFEEVSKIDLIVSTAAVYDVNNPLA